MTAVQAQDAASVALASGQRLRLPGESGVVIADLVNLRSDGGADLYVKDDEATDSLRKVSLTSEQARSVRVLSEDGAAAPQTVIAGLWTEWMLGAVRSASSTVLASTPLRPLPHQMAAVYGQMINQPLLRFLLADEPGTGKTIMSGLWLREAQRKGLVKRALVVCPAHLVIKWRADFERFFGGGLREVTAETIRQRALSVPGEDLWVVSLNLAAMNPAVREALHPDKAGWDAIIFDEAHRMTPTAETFHRVGMELSAKVPHAVFLTATPHRGDEWYFRELLHLVDPDVFPTSREPDSGLPKRPRSDSDKPRPGAPLKPGPLHFLRRMKEELVDYDSQSLLFKEREAQNIKVPMNSEEQRFYDGAQELVANYFHVRGRALAAMVYGKRAASSLRALAETLRRRLVKMGTADALGGEDQADEDDDEREERVVTAGSLNAREEKKAINALLAELEPLLGSGSGQLALGNLDVSKWEPMLNCLRGNGITPGSGQQLVVFTEYADTARWLVRMFVNEGFTAEEYSGTLDHTERSKIQARFMDGRFEVIVSTDAGNEGIDLQAAHVLVNWDIPWSLVRLEQRMGRIHRIGQQHKVHLYNLVALGTREGQAHERLLDRLIEAANELDGKMFDSLNAIMERIRSDTGAGEHERLLRLFYDTDSGASFGGDWPTLEQIRQARDDYYAEVRALSSKVDETAANAARHDDHTARVNPIIVERFLGRIAAGGLLKRDRAPIGDEGFYYLSASQAEHGWQLPEGLRPTKGAALVATRADTRQKAIADGYERAADAVMLGPSDPELAALVHGLRERVAPEMWQGATLYDESAREDYTLFVYECDITEGSNGSDPRHRERTSTASWLIRVDRSGSARPVSWDTLPNLAAAPNLTPVPLAPSVAEAAEKRAAKAADTERDRRAATLNGWIKQLSSQLRRLPNDLTDQIADKKRRTAARARIDATIRHRVNDAKTAAKVARGEPRRIGWAHIIAHTTHDDPDENADEQANSEAVSMRLVTDLLEGDGWRVEDVHTEGRGYDLHAVRGAEQRCVEVKGRAGKASTTGITLTGGELAQAAQLGDDYWLYVVDECADGIGHLYGAWKNPIQTFPGGFTDIPLWRLPGSELKAALDKQGDTS